MSATPGSSNLPTVLGFSSVHVGKSLLWAGEDALTLYILIRFVGLSPALAGTLFLVSALWNAACDGLIGAALRRSSRLWRWMPAIAVPAILASALGFAALPFVAGRSPWTAAALLLLFRTGFSLADVPHNGLTRLLAAEGQHLRAARIRAIGSASATLVIGVVCVAMLRPGPDAQSVTIMLAAGVGCTAMVMMAPLPFLLAAHRGPVMTASVEPPRSRRDNASLLIFCLATMVGLVGLAAAGKAILHLGFVATGSAILLLVTVGRLGSVWLWSPVAARIGNRIGLSLAYASAGAIALCLPLIPHGGTTAGGILLTLFGITGGGIALLNWAVLTEAIAAARRTSPSAFTEGFGLFTMSMKIALGLSAALVGWWLSTTGSVTRVDTAAFWPLALFIAAATGVAAATIALSGGPARNRPVQAPPSRSAAS